MQPMRTRTPFCHAALSTLPSAVSMLAILLLLLAGCQRKSVATHRENGWYHVTGTPNDSLSLELSLLRKISAFYDWIRMPLVNTQFLDRYIRII